MKNNITAILAGHFTVCPISGAAFNNITVEVVVPEITREQIVRAECRLMVAQAKKAAKKAAAQKRARKAHIAAKKAARSVKKALRSLVPLAREVTPRPVVGAVVKSWVVDTTQEVKTFVVQTLRRLEKEGHTCVSVVLDRMGCLDLL